MEDIRPKLDGVDLRIVRRHGPYAGLLLALLHREHDNRHWFPIGRDEDVAEQLGCSKTTIVRMRRALEEASLVDTRYMKKHAAQPLTHYKLLRWTP